jgi:hypothetical protein
MKSIFGLASFVESFCYIQLHYTTIYSDYGQNITEIPARNFNHFNWNRLPAAS